MLHYNINHVNISWYVYDWNNLLNMHISVYTKPVNIVFRVHWLASSEVNSKYYSPPSEARWLLRVTSVKKAGFDP